MPIRAMRFSGLSGSRPSEAAPIEEGDEEEEDESSEEIADENAPATAHDCVVEGQDDSAGNNVEAAAGSREDTADSSSAAVPAGVVPSDDSASYIKAFVRIRPLSAAEEAFDAHETMKVEADRSGVILTAPKVRMIHVFVAACRMVLTV